MRMPRNRIIVALALTGVLLATTSATAGASGTTPAGAIHFTKWGWVTVRNGTHAGTYIPAAADRGNSAGKKNVVAKTGSNEYTITMRGIGDDGGAPQVSTFGNTRRMCVLDGWGRVGANQQIYVRCFKLNAHPSPAAFTVSFLATNIEAGSLAYLYTSGTGSEDAPSQYSFNSSGAGPNHIDRSSAGAYTVTLPGLSSNHGNVQITARVSFVVASRGGVTPAGVNPPTCNLASWVKTGADELIAVRCFDIHGLAVDSEFTLIYTKDDGLKGRGKGKVAYVWADNPTAASYHAKPAYRFARPSGIATISRLGLGSYAVTLPSMPAGGAVKVTAYGTTGARCVVSSIRTSASPQRIGVRCSSLSGTAKNAKFTLSYER